MADDNLLLNEVDYQFTESAHGLWRRHVNINGDLFEEYVSNASVMGLPLVHFTRGKCPETGKRIVARGIFAIGRMAVGVVAIGQGAAGLIAIGQMGLGLVFGLGQLATGLVCVGQLALGVVASVGQMATGYVTIAQMGLGRYVLAQRGVGQYVWDSVATDPTAKEFFSSILWWLS